MRKKTYPQKFQVDSQVKRYLNTGFISLTDDSDEEEAPEHHTKQEEQETVFARLEKSRKMLEDELGFDRFIKVYKYIQVSKIHIVLFQFKHSFIQYKYTPRSCVCNSKESSLPNGARKTNLDPHKRIFKIFNNRISTVKPLFHRKNWFAARCEYLHLIKKNSQ